MKRITIATLVAGLMITGCALGMQKTETINQINALAETIGSKAAAKPMARNMAKSSIENTTSPAKKLNAMLQVVQSNNFTDTTNKQLFIDQINKLYLEVAPPLAKSAPVRSEYTAEFPGVTTIDVDPADVDPALTCRPPTKTAAAPAPTSTTVVTPEGVTIEDAPDTEVTPEIQPTPAPKKRVKIEQPNSEKTKFSAMGILRSPVFIGLVGLSTLAAITYAYFKKAQKTKRAKNLGTDLDEDSTEDILLA